MSFLNRLLLAISVGLPELLVYMPGDGSTRMALIPMLVMAGVAAAAAVAGSIANAKQNADKLSSEAAQSELNRRQQADLAMEQANAARDQQNRAREADANGNLINSMQTSAQAGQQAAARGQQATQDLQGSLSRAYLTQNSSKFGGRH